MGAVPRRSLVSEDPASVADERALNFRVPNDQRVVSSAKAHARDVGSASLFVILGNSHRRESYSGLSPFRAWLGSLYGTGHTPPSRRDKNLRDEHEWGCVGNSFPLTVKRPD